MGIQPWSDRMQVKCPTYCNIFQALPYDFFFFSDFGAIFCNGQQLFMVLIQELVLLVQGALWDAWAGRVQGKHPMCYTIFSAHLYNF